MSIVTLNDRAVRSVTAFGSIHTGSMVFIKKLTASSSANLSFVNGSSDVVLDSTYKEYLFTFKDIHPQNDGRYFRIGFRDGSTDYDATTTTTFFNTYHPEDDSTTQLAYETGLDQAQSTDPVKLIGAGRNKDYDWLGFSHWAHDDKEHLSGFKNIKKLWPKDETDMEKVFKEMVYSNDPYYVNLSR